MRPSTATVPCFIASAKPSRALLGLTRGRAIASRYAGRGDARRLLDDVQPVGESSASSQRAAIETASRSSERSTHGSPVRAQGDPAPLVAGRERAEEDAHALGGLGRDDRRQLLACRRRRAARGRRNLLELLRETHEAELRLAAWPSSRERRRHAIEPVRAAWGDVRPLRAAALVRAGRAAGGASSSIALAAGPGRSPCSTSPRAPGTVAIELVRRKGCRVIGLDQSVEMLEVARERVPPDVELVHGDADQLPFEDGVVRRAHVHVPLPLRRRSRGDARRAGASRAGPAGRSRGSSSACPKTRSPGPPGRRTSAGVSRWPDGSSRPSWAEVGGFLGDSVTGLLARPGRSIGCSEPGVHAGIEDVPSRSPDASAEASSSGGGARDAARRGTRCARAAGATT